MFKNKRQWSILLISVLTLLIGLYFYRDKLNWEVKVSMPFSCPSNYLRIESNEKYKIKSFCVSPYEMRKDENGKVSSQKEGTIWNQLTKEESLKACQSLGPGYDLISNSQWQVIAQEIELNGENWSSGITGIGCLYSGKLSGRSCNFETSNKKIIKMPYIPFSQKLKSGQKIFDFSTNVWEFINSPGANIDLGENTYADIVSKRTSPAQFKIDTNGLSGDIKFHFGAAETYLFNDKYLGGLGKLTIIASRPVVTRGGLRIPEKNMGIFSTWILENKDYKSRLTGFRCIYNL